MPLIGLVDPSHRERVQDKPGRLPNWLSIDEVLLQLMEPNPKVSPWTFELALAVISNHQERGDRLSTSLLTAACPRSSVIERMEDWVGALDMEYASLRGTMVHRTLEAYPRLGSVPETRFYTTVDGIEFSCTPDLLTQEAVYDYKVTAQPPAYNYPYRHHTEQVQFNAFVTRHAERWCKILPDGTEAETDLPFDPRAYPVQHVVVVYLGEKWPKLLEYERAQEFVTPTGEKREAKRPCVWDDEEVLDLLRPRLSAFKRAFEVYPDWPDGVEELWGGPPGWKCHGPPVCNIPSCIARRDPGQYAWERDCEACHGSGRKGRGKCSKCGGRGK